MVEMNLAPVHPGEMIKEDILEPLGLNVTKAAEILKVSRGALSTLLNERASLTADMALRIEKAFDVRMEFLLKVQATYDAKMAREHEAEIQVERYKAA